ncbi:MAG: hypothetical protein DDT40_01829 [candidate division WS2 bacterium]|nr:hypothetical protein [Candidatus Psychracetigena formicireducens]
MFTYKWIGLDLETGEVLRLQKPRYNSLRSAERSIELFIAKHLSDRDPEDLIFEVIKTDNRGRESFAYIKAKEDLGEEVGIDERYHFFDLRRGDIAKAMCVKEVDALLRKMKKDGIMWDIDAKELDPFQELKLANVVHRMKRSR